MLFSFSWWMQKLKPMVLKSKSYTSMKKNHILRLVVN